MTDEIRLPRSGIVLTEDTTMTETGPWFSRKIGPLTITLRAYRGAADPPEWVADVRTCGQEHGAAWRLSRDECISWLDSRVLELRAALMPADARERIAKTCFDFDRVADWSEATPHEREQYLEQADAILSALAGDVTPRPEPEVGA